MYHAVIMAGGSGTRFWPLSRQAVPKQFLNVSGERSLIQMAFDRCQPWIPAERTWVVTNDRLTVPTREHLPEVPESHILREPCGRNTAPCVGLAALCLVAEDPEAVMLVMPADHVIGPHEQFERSVKQAVQIVTDDPQRLVLFGVPPTYPSTGFGYIERGNLISSGAYEVAAFREKPDHNTATDYLRQGTFYWNCGIFVWRASRILQAIQQYEPEMYELLQQLQPYIGSSEWQSKLNEYFPAMKGISIDYAVLERADSIAVVEATFDWDDVGSWNALERLNPTDEHGNTIIGPSVTSDVQNCILRTTDNHLIGAIGVRNCIIVHTPDATLVADRTDEAAVKQLVEILQARGDESYL